MAKRILVRNGSYASLYNWISLSPIRNRIHFRKKPGLLQVKKIKLLNALTNAMHSVLNTKLQEPTKLTLICSKECFQ
ncbi:hypothetical protein CVS40_10309 [Lucilia cuprina]|nr:hypothetical protein CVS40_10309 [Lucilia cuprina]